MCARLVQFAPTGHPRVCKKAVRPQHKLLNFCTFYLLNREWQFHLTYVLIEGSNTWTT